MRLKLVVLPAPLGPISASVSPSFTEKLRSCTARKPPKRLLRLRTISASAIEQRLFRAWRPGTCHAPINVREHAEQAGWPPKNDGNQDQAVDGQLYATGAAAEPAL